VKVAPGRLGGVGGQPERPLTKNRATSAYGVKVAPGRLGGVGGQPERPLTKNRATNAYGVKEDRKKKVMEQADLETLRARFESVRGRL
jgi:hypothetical protein